MGKTKAELHAELDVLVPPDTLKRNHIRMVGHALIELGLITDLYCSYEFCKQESREFRSPPGGKGAARHSMVVSLDHVVSLDDGGTDMPDNLQLLHFACNAGKGARDAWSKDNKKAAARRAANSVRTTERMQGEHGEKMRNRMSGENCTDETRRKRSEAMKRVWADPERGKALRAAPAKSWETRRAREQ